MGKQRTDVIRPKKRFRTILTSDVISFLEEQDIKTRQKILSNIRKAEVMADPELFKKLTEEIWEFRTLWNRKRYRLLAFWDKEEGGRLLKCLSGSWKRQ